MEVEIPMKIEGTDIMNDDGAGKKKRRNMFDVGPEGQISRREDDDLPLYDDGKGQIVAGPGAGGLQPRPSEAKRALPKLTRPQEEALAKAKRYAMEMSVQHVLNKQKVVQVEQMTTLQTNAQRQRALALMCRIYVGSINFELKEDSIRSSFIPFGPIKKIDMSWDPTTMKHKGFAFVEYELPEAAQLALEQMNGALLGGRNAKVGRPSNVPQAAPWIEQILEEARQYARIYVSSIHPDLTENDIKSVFEAFGRVKDCSLTPDNVTGKHKGYGFVEYETHQSATDAIASMNLFDLGGQYLRVGRAITPPANAATTGPLPTAAALAAAAVSAKIQAQEAAALGVPVVPTGPTVITSVAGVPMAIPASSLGVGSPLGSITTAVSTNITAFLGAGIAPVSEAQMTAQPQAVAQSPPTSSQKTSQKSNSSKNGHGSGDMTASLVAQASKHADVKAKIEMLGDDVSAKASEQNLSREEDMKISGKEARYIMMQKLSRQSRSKVLVLRNMVSVEDIDDDLEMEVTDECRKFGEVNRVIIYQEKQGEEEDAAVVVKVFVEFNEPEEAEKAQSVFNGRWFGGNCIIGEIYDEEKFNAGDFFG
ncbi:poly(U)-binding-splicing factor PUF60-like [Rhopilema esculentum]|uniref:poly(U)-binding-splicing factor PUF60-like n=1 Tax=Rhopilema esculentum TaxID=499914 RepID=UPI0031D051BE